MMTAPPAATTNAGDTLAAGGGGGSLSTNNNYTRKPTGNHPAKTPSSAVSARGLTKMPPATGTVNGEGVTAQIAQQLINGLAKTKNHVGKGSPPHQQILSQKRSNTSADNLSPLQLSESENEDDPEPITNIINSRDNTAPRKLYGSAAAVNGTNNKENKANGINGTKDNMRAEYLDEMLPELQAAAAAAAAHSDPLKKKTNDRKKSNASVADAAKVKDVSSESNAVAEIAEQKPIDDAKTIKDEIENKEAKTEKKKSIIPNETTALVEENAKTESLIIDDEKLDEIKNSDMSVENDLLMESSEKTLIKSEPIGAKDDDVLLDEKILLEEDDLKPDLNEPVTDDIILSDVEYLLDDEAEVLLSEKKIRDETRKTNDLPTTENDIVMKLEEGECTIKESVVKDVVLISSTGATNDSIATDSISAENQNTSLKEPSIGVKDLNNSDDVLEISTSTDESVNISTVIKADHIDTSLISDVEMSDELKDNTTTKMDVDHKVIEENSDVNNIKDEAVAIEGKHTTAAASREKSPSASAQNGSRPKRSSDVALQEGNSKKQRLVETKRKSSVGGAASVAKEATVSAPSAAAAVTDASSVNVRQSEPNVKQLMDYRSDDEVTVIFDKNSKSTKTSEATPEPEKTGEKEAKKKSDGSKQRQILETFSKLHDTLKGMTRKELELLLSAKLVDAIDASSDLAKYKERVKKLTDKMQKLEASLAQAQKHSSDQEYVKTKVTGLVDKSLQSGIQLVTPLYITRSVGLQVTINTPSASAHHSSKNSSRSSLTRSHSLPKQQQQQQQRKSSPQQHQQNAAQQTSNRSSSGPTRQQQPQHPQQTQPQQMQPQPVNIIRNLNAAPLEIVNPNTRSVTIDLTDEEDRPNGAGGGAYSPMLKQQQQQQQQPIFVVPQQNVMLSNGAAGGRSNTTAYVIGTLPTTGPDGNGNKGVITATAVGPPVNSRLMYTTPGGGGQQARSSAGTTSVTPPGQRRSGGGNPQSQRHTTCHPAPLPRPEQAVAVLPHGRASGSSRFHPSKPLVTISQVSQGIVISWTMPDETNDHAEVASYQIYAYQESDVPPTSDLWRKVGDVKAMPLPMACTLTQFTLGNRYHFAVRAVDVNSRVGHFSVPNSILLGEESL